MKLKLLLILPFFLFCTSMYKIEKAEVQEDVFVPNAETAIKVAEAIWLPIFGNGIYEKKPFKAELLNNEIWIVKGSLKPEEIGGVPIIKIQKKDCKIIELYHTK